jgi:hypothetical protein
LPSWLKKCKLKNFLLAKLTKWADRKSALLFANALYDPTRKTCTGNMTKNTSKRILGLEFWNEEKCISKRYFALTQTGLRAAPRYFKA